MGDNLFTTFKSAVGNDDFLEVLWAKDGDLHLTTYRSDCSYNACVRLRAYFGGGNSELLRKILSGLVAKTDTFAQRDFLNVIFSTSTPNDFKEFTFRCDDNPGSHIKIALAENAFSIQTGCHDEERDNMAGGFSSRQGEGPMVWISKNHVPRVYDELKSCLINGINPNPVLYDPPFKFLTLEAHA